jgi:hypothetical protein
MEWINVQLVLWRSTLQQFGLDCQVLMNGKATAATCNLRRQTSSESQLIGGP